jgi:hypothetical protein
MERRGVWLYAPTGQGEQDADANSEVQNRRNLQRMREPFCEESAESDIMSWL